MSDNEGFVSAQDKVAWAIAQALHAEVPESIRPMSWSDFSPQQKARIKAAADAAIDSFQAEAPAPTDRIAPGYFQGARTEDEAVANMLAALSARFGEPVLPVSRFCDKFRAWARAVEAAAERTKGTHDFDVHWEMFQRIRAIQLDITKSNLLYRLLFLGESVRTDPCPVHKGRWSGCVAPENECPHCMSGSNVTGWVRQADSV